MHTHAVELGNHGPAETRQTGIGRLDAAVPKQVSLAIGELNDPKTRARADSLRNLTDEIVKVRSFRATGPVHRRIRRGANDATACSTHRDLLVGKVTECTAPKMGNLSPQDQYVCQIHQGFVVAALVQFNGKSFSFCNNHLCHLNVEKFTHR